MPEISIVWFSWITVPIGLVMLGIILWQVKRAKQPKQIAKIKEAEIIPSRREALEMARVAWGLWNTGTRMRIEKLLEIESLKRVLILEQNPTNPAIQEVAKRAREKPDSIISQIRETTIESLENGVKVRWYFKSRMNLFTIYDSTPIEGDNGELKPCSENAWIFIESFDPFIGVDQRRGECIYNKGKGRNLFDGYYREYEDIWNDPNKSVEPSITEDKTNPSTLKTPRPPELQISYQKHEFGVDNGVSIITVYAEYRPTGKMRVEAIELQLVGKHVPSLDWKGLEVSQDLWYTSDNKFKVPDGISPGEHDAKLAAFANGEWWGSQPFTIAFPEVNS